MLCMNIEANWNRILCRTLYETETMEIDRCCESNILRFRLQDIEAIHSIGRVIHMPRERALTEISTL